jgi:hypothetical protein
MPTIQEQISTTAPMVAFEFQTTDIADAAGTFKALQATSNEYVMPWAGHVVAISAALNGALSTGTLTLRSTINGTAKTGLTTTLSSTAQTNYATKPQGTVPFAAGVKLGADWTKSGTVNPTTTDGVVTLFVVFENALT